MSSSIGARIADRFEFRSRLAARSFGSGFVKRMSAAILDSSNQFTLLCAPCPEHVLDDPAHLGHAVDQSCQPLLEPMLLPEETRDLVG